MPSLVVSRHLWSPAEPSLALPCHVSCPAMFRMTSPLLVSCGAVSRQVLALKAVFYYCFLRCHVAVRPHTSSHFPNVSSGFGWLLYNIVILKQLASKEPISASAGVLLSNVIGRQHCCFSSTSEKRGKQGACVNSTRHALCALPAPSISYLKPRWARFRAVSSRPHLAVSSKPVLWAESSSS